MAVARMWPRPKTCVWSVNPHGSCRDNQPNASNAGAAFRQSAGGRPHYSQWVVRFGRALRASRRRGLWRVVIWVVAELGEGLGQAHLSAADHRVFDDGAELGIAG